jgi:hypothetical protein
VIIPLAELGAEGVNCPNLALPAWILRASEEGTAAVATTAC